MYKKETTFYRILQLVNQSGHTTLVIDDVAADYELKEVYKAGLHSKITVIVEEETSN